MLLRNLHRINIHPILIPPLLLTNLNIIPTHHPLPHNTILIERPILEPIAALPLHPIMGILILVPELNGDLIISKREELFTQLVVVLFVPLPGQKFDDLLRAGEEVVAVAPDAVGGVGFGDGYWVAVGLGG